MLMRTFPLPNFLEAKRRPCLILFAFQKICWSAVDGHDSTLHKVVENSSKSFHVSMVQRHACLPWMMCRCRQPQFYTSNQGVPQLSMFNWQRQAWAMQKPTTTAKTTLQTEPHQGPHPTKDLVHDKFPCNYPRQRCSISTYFQLLVVHMFCNDLQSTPKRSAQHTGTK